MYRVFFLGKENHSCTVQMFLPLPRTRKFLTRMICYVLVWVRIWSP